MLRGGDDRLGRRIASLELERGWVEWLVAQLLQQPHVGGRWSTPRQPREARSRTAHTSERQLRSRRRRMFTIIGRAAARQQF